MTANSHTIRKLQSLFSSKCGFGEQHTATAYNLMRDTCVALEKHGITHFIISGTLLGHKRHDGFTPWDDDIDICVDNRLHDPQVLAEFQNSNPSLIIQPVGDHALKISYHKSHGGQTISNPREPDNPKEYEYTWPFIDIFFYTHNPPESMLDSISEAIPEPNNLSTQLELNIPKKNEPSTTTIMRAGAQINFFGKNWQASEFLPPRKIIFGRSHNGDEIITYEPSNPNYFLSKNYGPNYMNEIVSSGYLHKYECHNRQHAYRTTMKVYNTHKNKIG